MQDLAEVPGRGFTEHMGFNIPNDYIETELRDTVFDLHDDLTSDEFIWVNKEFLRKHCKYVHALIAYSLILVVTRFPIG